MKTILALLALTLSVDAQLSDAAKAIYRGPPPAEAAAPPGMPKGAPVGATSVAPPGVAAALTVRAAGRIGPNPKPGDRVIWLIDIQNHGEASVPYLIVLQSPMNLNVAQPRVVCLSPPKCSLPAKTAVASAPMPFLQIPGGAHMLVGVGAAIAGPGPFHVVIRTATTPAQLRSPSTIATLSGYAMAAPQPAPQPQPQPAPQPYPQPAPQPYPQPAPLPQPAPQPVPQPQPAPVAPQPAPPTPIPQPPPAPQPPPPAPEVSVATSLTPIGPYRQGERVTATFTFTSSGDAPLVIVLQRDRPRNLEVTARSGDCAPPCRATLYAGRPLTSIIDAVIVGAPGGGPPVDFADTVAYRAGGHTATAAVSDAVTPPERRPPRPRLPTGPLIGLAALFAAAAVGFAIHHARLLKWRRLVAIQAHVDPAEVGPPPAKIPEAAPTVRLAVRVEPGDAGPRGPLPVRRTS